mmetsp:Transcript_63901/g.187448  ORF Transcript_63901/g.187448 Transcript_63901/m.187448 type:complete len:257 (+) Transcript_63901:583-1353(+)
MDPRARSMPRYGGRPVDIFRTGTSRIRKIPKVMTSTLDLVTFSLSGGSSQPNGAASSSSLVGVLLPSSWCPRFWAAPVLVPLRWPAICRAAFWGVFSAIFGPCMFPQDQNTTGRVPDTSDGTKSHFAVGTVLIFPWIHSIVVVTSPIALHAPPALAAITMRPPHRCRKSLSSGTRRRRILSETIVAVRLSITELRKNVRKHKIGIRRPKLPFMDFWMSTVTQTNAPKWSMDSTTPMAGRRKSMTLPTSCRPRSSSW